MADIFREVREALDMGAVARFYGYEPNRAGFIRCPFHADKTASLKLYPGARGWHCFGCNRGGSVIDFVALTQGIPPLEAVRRLNEDFLLGLPVDGAQTAADRKEVARRKTVGAIYRDFEAWSDRLCAMLNACFYIAHEAVLSLKGTGDFDRLTPAQVLAIQYQPVIEFQADCLSGSMDEQMEVFRDREEIERLCERILNSMQTKCETA